jgi:hypothetical protein
VPAGQVNEDGERSADLRVSAKQSGDTKNVSPLFHLMFEVA